MNLTNLLQPKKLLKKKRAESVVGNAIMLTLALAVIFLVMRLMLNYYSTIHAVEEVNVVARNYLLKMELNNCLNQSDLDGLVESLTDLGVVNIKLSGNFDPAVSATYIQRNDYAASYGEEVYIQIEGLMNVDVKQIKFFGIDIDISKPTVNLNVRKKGVAVK